MSSLVFEPLISPSVWTALVVLTVVLIVFYAWQRQTGVTRFRWGAIVLLMGVGAALPLVLLLNPTWINKIPRPGGKPTLTILVDRSASMATADADRGQTRFQSAGDVARQCARELCESFDVRVKTFAEAVTSLDAADLAGVTPDGAVSDLAGAMMDRSEDGSSGEAMLLLSDGVHNAGGGGMQSVLAAARVTRAAGIPVYTQSFGRESDVSDLAIRLPMSQQLCFQGQKIPLTVFIKRRGHVAPQARVSLWQNERRLDERELFLEKTAETETAFQVSEPKPGLYRYEVRVEAAPGEVTTINNQASFLLRVTDRPIRVLVLEGAPYWDAKFLMRTLAADASVELDAFVRITPNRFMRRTILRRSPDEASSLTEAAEPLVPGEPARETVAMLTDEKDFTFTREQLRRYQVIVLGREAESYLTDSFLAELRLWISQDSGALVCSRGRPLDQVTQALDRLLPVRWVEAPETRFRLSMTDQGRSLQWLPTEDDPTGQMLHQLPSLTTKSDVDYVKPLTSVLAAGTAAGDHSAPAISYQPFGAGRVVVVEGSGMWRWAFLPPKYQQHEQVYHEVWRSLVRWLISGAGLMPGERAALRAEKVSFTTSEEITAQLLVRDDTEIPDVELRGGALSEPRRIRPVPLVDEPFTYRTPFGRLPEGRYEARVVGDGSWGQSAVTVFDVRQFLDEQLDITARPDVMARIASATGGTALQTVDTRALIEQFRRYLDVNRPERVIRQPAWDRGWVLAAVLAVWAMVWGLRRSSGLI